MVNIFQLEKKRGSKEKKKEIQGYYWNYLVNIFQLEKKEEDQKLKKKGNWPFATQNLSQYILFLEKKKKKKREKRTAAKFSQVERSYHVTSFFSFSYSLK